MSIILISQWETRVAVFLFQTKTYWVTESLTQWQAQIKQKRKALKCTNTWPRNSASRASIWKEDKCPEHKNIETRCLCFKDKTKTVWTLKTLFWLGMVLYTFNIKMQEAGTRASLWAPDQSGLCIELQVNQSCTGTACSHDKQTKPTLFSEFWEAYQGHIPNHIFHTTGFQFYSILFKGQKKIYVIFFLSFLLPSLLPSLPVFLYFPQWENPALIMSSGDEPPGSLSCLWGHGDPMRLTPRVNPQLSWAM